MELYLIIIRHSIKVYGGVKEMGQFKGIMKKITCMGIMTIALLGIGGCGSSKDTSSQSKHYETAEDTASYAVPSEEEAGSLSNEMKEEAPYASEVEGEFSSNDTPMIHTETAYNRKIIKNGEMTIQTKEFTETTEEMIAYLQKLGGYIEEMNIDGTNFYDQGNKLRTASLKIRIPHKQFDTFVNNGGEFGIVAGLTCTTEDVTSSYVDAEIRIQTLQTRYDRLMALMEKSGDLTELFKLEQEISNVSYEIEQYKGTLNKYDSLVDMGTLTVQIEEVEEIKEVTKKAPDTFVQQIQKTFNTSLNGVLSFLRGLVILIAGIMPTLIILIPVGILVWRFAKKYLNDSIGYKNKGESKEHHDDEMRD